MKIKEYEDTYKNALARKIQTTYAAKLDKSSTQLVMDMLAKLYSEPHAAVLREYVSNAYDANVEANATKPVEVHLPEVDEPYLSVRDYGSGLDYLSIVSVFANFGTSTKRDSDNLIGGFGIGSKSGLAVSDSVQISSVSNGILNEFVLERTPNGIFTRFTRENEKTTQDSGTTVTIDYSDKVKDTYNEKRYHGETSPKTTLCGWSKNEVFVTNNKYEDLNEHRVPDTWYFNGSEYRAPSTEKVNTSLKGFLIGKVFYDIPFRMIMSSAFDYNETLSLIIPFDIKDIKVTYSREKIDFDDKDTLNRVKDAIEAAKYHVEQEYANIADDNSLQPYEKIKKLNNIGIYTPCFASTITKAYNPIPNELDEPAVILKLQNTEYDNLFKATISTNTVDIDSRAEVFVVFDKELPKRPTLKMFIKWLLFDTGDTYKDIKGVLTSSTYTKAIATTTKGYAKMYFTANTPSLNVQAAYDAFTPSKTKVAKDLNNHEFNYYDHWGNQYKKVIDSQWLRDHKVVFIHPKVKYSQNKRSIEALSKLLVPNPRAHRSDIETVVTKTKKEYEYLTNFDPNVPTITVDDITAFNKIETKWQKSKNINDALVTANFFRNLMMNDDKGLNNILWTKSPFANQMYIDRKICTITEYHKYYNSYDNKDIITKAYNAYVDRYTGYVSQADAEEIIDHITKTCAYEISMLQSMCDDLDKFIK